MLDPCGGLSEPLQSEVEIKYQAFNSMHLKNMASFMTAHSTGDLSPEALCLCPPRITVEEVEVEIG